MQSVISGDYGSDVDRAVTCLSPDLGLPISHAEYGADGTRFETTLVEYEAP